MNKNIDKLYEEAMNNVSEKADGLVDALISTVSEKIASDKLSQDAVLFASQFLVMKVVKDLAHPDSTIEEFEGILNKVKPCAFDVLKNNNLNIAECAYVGAILLRIATDTVIMNSLPKELVEGIVEDRAVEVIENVSE